MILIERDKMGGECLNYGCVPSKALLHASQEKDFEKTMANVKNAIHAIESHDSIERFEGLGVKVFFGEARFKDVHHISVGKDVIHTKYCVIATGSEASVPQLSGLDKVDFFTNKTVVDMKVQPKRLGIIGGGPIGIEMAQAFSNMGTKVSVIQHSRILARDDKEAVDVVRAQLIKQGVEFYEHSDVSEVKKKGKHIHLMMPKGEVKCSELLLAAGRRPSICALDLKK